MKNEIIKWQPFDALSAPAFDKDTGQAIAMLPFTTKEPATFALVASLTDDPPTIRCCLALLAVAPARHTYRVMDGNGVDDGSPDSIPFLLDLLDVIGTIDGWNLYPNYQDNADLLDSVLSIPENKRLLAQYVSEAEKAGSLASSKIIVDRLFAASAVPAMTTTPIINVAEPSVTFQAEQSASWLEPGDTVEHVEAEADSDEDDSETEDEAEDAPRVSGHTAYYRNISKLAQRLCLAAADLGQASLIADARSGKKAAQDEAAKDVSAALAAISSIVEEIQAEKIKKDYYSCTPIVAEAETDAFDDCENEILDACILSLSRQFCELSSILALSAGMLTVPLAGPKFGYEARRAKMREECRTARNAASRLLSKLAALNLT